MSGSPTPRLIFGGDYNPEQWDASLWPQDVRLMGEAGITTVTVGVFAWAALQPQPGRYDFAWLDTALDLLHAGGIRACLATATASPPAWLVQAHPDMLPVAPDGRRLGPGSRQHYCPSHPAYRTAARALTQQIAHRYGQHPAVELWHVNNEYGCHVQQCYCEVSAAAFRQWTQERYGDLESLNRAWTTTFWGQHLSDWEQIQPPRTAPTTLNPALVLDYRRFSSDALLECFLAEAAILREVSPGIPVTTNFVGLVEALDQHTWARHQDVVSLDSYPDPLDAEAAARQALTFDLTRSLGGGKPWLLMEQAPSAVNWRPVNAPKPEGVMRLWSHQALARGADGVMFFQFRQSIGGAEKWHSALVPHAGTSSRAWQDTVRLGADLGRLAEVAGSTLTADIALVLDWNNWWALGLDARPSSEIDLPERLLDLYRPLWEANLAVDVVGPGTDLSPYRMVIAPHLYLIDEGHVTELHRYVEDGGHLVMTYFSGLVDPHDRVRPGAYPGAFRDLLGLQVEEFWPLSSGAEVALEGQDGRVGTAGVWSEEITSRGAKTLVTFAEGPLAGKPAVLRHTHGTGTVTYLGCSPDPQTLRPLLAEAAQTAGVHPALTDVPEGVEVTARTDQQGQVLFLLNHNDHAVPVPVPASRVVLGDEPDAGILTLAAHDVAVLRPVATR